jgi:hypothetical protein
MDNHVINFILLNLIFAYVINIRLFNLTNLVKEPKNPRCDTSYQRLVWIYKKGDFAKFNNLISQFDWYKLLSNCTQNINTSVTTTCWVKLNDCSREC